MLNLVDQYSREEWCVIVANTCKRNNLEIDGKAVSGLVTFILHNDAEDGIGGKPITMVQTKNTDELYLKNDMIRMAAFTYRWYYEHRNLIDDFAVIFHLNKFIAKYRPWLLKRCPRLEDFVILEEEPDEEPPETVDMTNIIDLITPAIEFARKMRIDQFDLTENIADLISRIYEE